MKLKYDLIYYYTFYFKRKKLNVIEKRALIINKIRNWKNLWECETFIITHLAEFWKFCVTTRFLQLSQQELLKPGHHGVRRARFKNAMIFFFYDFCGNYYCDSCGRGNNSIYGPYRSIYKPKNHLRKRNNSSVKYTHIICAL